jgi:glycosyltransferase involved in cell wall biosynthesis
VTSGAVSVVMTAWNAERFIEEAIASALGQTVPPAAVVVVDDGSTDTSASIAAAFGPRVTVLRREHAGIGPARTAGIAATSSEFVAFLDADDVWLTHKLERQLELMEADPSVEAVFCMIDEFHDDAYAPPAGVRQPRCGVAGALSSAALVRRDLIDRLGSFEATPVGEWVGWWARARAMAVHEACVPEVLMRRRLHEDNNSFRSDDDGATFFAIAREHSRAMRAKRGIE